jgi:hypothetical protein
MSGRCVPERPTFARSKALLKQPHSKRFATTMRPSNRAKRLECARFTAAFARTNDTQVARIIGRTMFAPLCASAFLRQFAHPFNSPSILIRVCQCGSHPVCTIPDAPWAGYKFYIP